MKVKNKFTGTLAEADGIVRVYVAGAYHDYTSLSEFSKVWEVYDEKKD